MIKKLNIDELEPGMYVCALERDNSSDVLSFMNNILVGSTEDIERFKKAGYKAAHVDLPDEEPETAPPVSPGDGETGFEEAEVLANSPEMPSSDTGRPDEGGLPGGVDPAGSAAPDLFSGPFDPADPGADQGVDKAEAGLYEVDLGNTGFVDETAEDEISPEQAAGAAKGLDLEVSADFDLSGPGDDFPPPSSIDELEGAGDQAGAKDTPAPDTEGVDDRVIEDAIEAVDEGVGEGVGENATENAPGDFGRRPLAAAEDLDVTEGPGPASPEAIDPIEPFEAPDDAPGAVAAVSDDPAGGEQTAPDQNTGDHFHREGPPVVEPEDAVGQGEGPAVDSLFTGNDYVGGHEAVDTAGVAPVEDDPAEEGPTSGDAPSGDENGGENLAPLEGTDFLENPMVEAGDDNGGPDSSGPAVPGGPAQADYKEQFRDYKEELDDAKRIRNEAEGLVREFLSNVKEGEGIQADKVHSTVENMVDSIFRNQDALTSLARLKSFDDYTFAHCVNVCTLTVTLGRHMGLDREQLHELGVGSILHDVGKMLVPEGILNKPGKLSDDEFKVMRDHTVMGAEILDKTSGVTARARDVACHHHELYDGRGYPRGLAGDDISDFARITTVADVYDAMTSNRVYQKGMKSDEALKKMYMWRGERFEPQLVERLIRCLGIYPIGTLVEINTGEIAVVRLPNHTNPLKPLVMMIYDKDGVAYPKPFASALGDDEERWITGSRNPEEFGEALQDLTVCV